MPPVFIINEIIRIYLDHAFYISNVYLHSSFLRKYVGVYMSYFIIQFPLGYCIELLNNIYLVYTNSNSLICMVTYCLYTGCIFSCIEVFVIENSHEVNINVM